MLGGNGVMSNEWEFFQCQMEQGPASIFLDIGIHSSLPLADYSHLLNIRLTLKSPREDGLSSSEEFPVLCDLEDSIEDVFKSHKVIYAGRITYNKKREYYFYCRDFSCKDILTSKFSNFGYQVELAQVEDPEWSAYYQSLYPTADDWQVIKDRRVVDNLLKHKDNLAKARVIDHHAYFEDKQSVEFYVQKIIELGFKVESIELGEDGRFQVDFSRDDKPEFPQITSITLPLRRLAETCKGSYGGWGTYIENE